MLTRHLLVVYWIFRFSGKPGGTTIGIDCVAAPPLRTLVSSGFLMPPIEPAPGRVSVGVSICCEVVACWVTARPTELRNTHPIRKKVIGTDRDILADEPIANDRERLIQQRCCSFMVPLPNVCNIFDERASPSVADIGA